MVEVQADNRGPLALHLQYIEVVHELADVLYRETRGFWAKSSTIEVPRDFHYFRRWVLNGRRDDKQMREGNEKARALAPELFDLYDSWNQHAEPLWLAIDQAESHLFEDTVDFADGHRAVGDQQRTHRLELLMRLRHCFPSNVEPGPPDLERLNERYPSIRNALDLIVVRTRAQLDAGVTGVYGVRGEDAVTVAARSIPEVVVGLEEVEALWSQGDAELSEIASWMGPETGGFEKLGRSMRGVLDRHLNWVNRKIDQVLPALDSSLADQVLALSTKLGLDAYVKDTYGEKRSRWRQQWSVTGIEPYLVQVCRRLRAVVIAAPARSPELDEPRKRDAVRSDADVEPFEAYEAMDWAQLADRLRRHISGKVDDWSRNVVSDVFEKLLELPGERVTTAQIAKAGLGESTLRKGRAKRKEIDACRTKQGRSFTFLRRVILWYVAVHWDPRAGSAQMS